MIWKRNICEIAIQKANEQLLSSNAASTNKKVFHQILVAMTYFNENTKCGIGHGVCNLGHLGS